MLKKLFKIILLFFSFLFITGLFSYLTVNYFIKNEKSVVVPDLVDKDVIGVLELLTELGLNTKLKGSEFNPAIPRNRVISQQPEPGTIIKKGRDVKIIVSRGTRKIIMPDLQRMPMREAGILLEENGLSTGNVAYVSNDNIPRESIISQYPFPGSMVQRDKQVDLLVSTGRKPIYYKMTDLTGMLLDEAILTIEKHNLKLGKITSRPVERVVENAVTDHDPPSGYRVARGSTVNLVINRPQNLKNDSSLLGHTGVRIFRHRIANGFLKKHVKVQINSSGSITKLYDGYAKPGKELWFLVPLYTNETLFLYEDDKLVETRFFD